MISPDFSWLLRPFIMATKIGTLNDKIIAAMHTMGDALAQKMQSHAQATAPWNDQSGNARQGIRGFAMTMAASVTIYLVHSVLYGVYLEMGTRFMGARAVLLPTLEAHYGEVMQMMRAALAGL